MLANPEIPLRFTQPVGRGLELMCANVNCKLFLFTQSIEIEIKHFFNMISLHKFSSRYPKVFLIQREGSLRGHIRGSRRGWRPRRPESAQS